MEAAKEQSEGQNTSSTHLVESTVPADDSPPQHTVPYYYETEAMYPSAEPCSETSPSITIPIADYTVDKFTFDGSGHFDGSMSSYTAPVNGHYGAERSFVTTGENQFASPEVVYTAYNTAVDPSSLEGNHPSYT